MLSNLRKELRELADSNKAKILQRFFKTGKGEYADGDVFLGVVVPKQRKIVARYWDLINLEDIKILLESKFHEERLVGLLCLVRKYEKNQIARKLIFDFYLENLSNINNWDLVDLSAPNIVGRYILENGKGNPFIEGKLFDMVQSDNLWERRVAVLATFYFIRNKRFAETLKLAEILLNDAHDLIHKAVGWMLREVGKKDERVLKDFLKENYQKMPRTMLRYAIEKFPESLRKKYLNGDI
jgi:3-methyladenine DNA glycosylase AlkD